MNGKQLEKKFQEDVSKVKKDLNTLTDDSAELFKKFEENINQVTGKAKDDLATWVEASISTLREEFEKLAVEARDTVVDTASTVKKDVGHGLSQYNAKVQEAAEKIPGGLNEKAAKYPWVAISIGLAFGLLLGVMFKPGRNPYR